MKSVDDVHAVRCNFVNRASAYVLCIGMEKGAKTTQTHLNRITLYRTVYRVHHAIRKCCARWIRSHTQAWESYVCHAWLGGNRPRENHDGVDGTHHAERWPHNQQPHAICVEYTVYTQTTYVRFIGLRGWHNNVFTYLLWIAYVLVVRNPNATDERKFRLELYNRIKFGGTVDAHRAHSPKNKYRSNILVTQNRFEWVWPACVFALQDQIE